MRGKHKIQIRKEVDAQGIDSQYSGDHKVVACTQTGHALVPTLSYYSPSSKQISFALETRLT